MHHQHCKYVLTTATCLQAAAYEACRVFKDCLVSSDHAAQFDSILANTLRKHWRVNLDLTSRTFATLGGPTLQLTTGETHVWELKLVLADWHICCMMLSDSIL